MLKSYLIIVVYLIVGFFVIGIAQIFKMPSWLNSAFVVLLLFVIVNLITAKIFRLNEEIKRFWSIKKLYFFPLGLLIGGFIAVAPVIVGLLFGKITISEITWKTTFSFASVFITLAIVAWEELWFRGIFLNYCRKKISPISISVTIGFLFMLVHLFNPEIDLLQTGPTLFFAGAFLTIVYFYFKTIWLPIGLHFGNNYFTLESNLSNHLFLGNEGYFGAIILSIFFFCFAIPMRHKTEF